MVLDLVFSKLKMQLNSENHSWWTFIDKLTYWKISEWIKYETKSAHPVALRIHYDQLLITLDDKIIETFNMNSKLRGIYKGDVLILIAGAHGQAQEIRKLKFQIKSNSTYCYERLGKHFPVALHQKPYKKDEMIYRNIEDMFRKALEDNGSTGSQIKLPSNYSEFVKLCLLDPTFPSVVEKTQRVIQEFKTNEK